MDSMDAPRFELVSKARPWARLPRRADPGSAGYDFYLPEDVVLPPRIVTLVFTDVKAWMPSDVVLLLTIRSSLARKGIFLANAPGVVDASYYNNPLNEGNIGLLLYNSTDMTVNLFREERVAQGVFVRYLLVGGDAPVSARRSGGFGSSGV